MTGEHKSYGYEGGFEDLTADKVYTNMRIMQDSTKENNETETVNTESEE